MIIDCHGHYTTAPAALQEYRDAQLARLADPALPVPAAPEISDDEIRQTIEGNQLRIARERGTDLTIFSPRASHMGHHIADPATAVAWAQVCNDLIARVTTLFPDNFAGVCQLPQVAGEPLDSSVEELDRCVTELGFVGCNLNPDPSGAWWTSPPLTDQYWFPLYEKMVELDVPAMIHVSTSCNPAAHTLGAHYLNADTTAFMQLLMGDLFGRFPTLRFVIPHGGGAVPYHWGRFLGIADQGAAPAGRDPADEQRLLRHLRVPPARHRPADHGHQAGQHPVRVGDAGRGPRQQPGRRLPLGRHQALRRPAPLSDGDRAKVFEGNARRVYPRLHARLEAQGG